MPRITEYQVEFRRDPWGDPFLRGSEVRSGSLGEVNLTLKMRLTLREWDAFRAHIAREYRASPEGELPGAPQLEGEAAVQLLVE